MNKDVIYIEPEDDITDIIAKVKAAKTKIVALVPPKKAGVLRSAVNFKLIAKTATQHNKTVVLITTDDNLTKFAQSVKMPVAKSLNSKPQLAVEDESEFGDEGDEADDVIEEADDDVSSSKSGKDKKEHKTSSDKTSEEKSKAAAATTEKEEVVTEDEVEEAEDEKSKKKKSNKKVPDFKKYRTQIIVGAIAAIALVVVLVWAFAIAPAAKIIVHVSTADKNFSEKIELTTDPDEEDIDAGVFYMEEKTIQKDSSADFEATGEEDRGTKASGTITVKRTSPVVIDDGMSEAITIPAGTKFTYNGLTYISTEQATLAQVNGSDVATETCSVETSDFTVRCDLAKDITTRISVQAAENGDKYNMSAANSGWSVSVAGMAVASSAEISGGTSKIVKIVSEDDLETAEESLDVSGESDARKELTETNSDEYILISGSFNVENGKLTSSPALGEEVPDGATPKVTKTTTYKIYAVSRDAINQYIEKVVKESIGDDTQTVYSTGAEKDAETTSAFFESYKNSNGKYTAKLKSTAKVGPRVTPEMVSEKALGQKIGQVRTMLTSINGVKDIEIERSYFWVTSFPSDPNKVEIEITVD